MYSLIISSVIVPELTARYPLAQKCRPQNFFRRCEYGFPEYPRADPLQPLHDLTDILVGPIREENVYVDTGHFATDNPQLMFHRELPDQVAHTTTDLKVHLVWIPKYRKAVLTGDVAVRVRATPISSHATTLHKFSLRLKARDFDQPERGSGIRLKAPALACRLGYRVLLLRFPRLFQALDIARSTGKLLGFFKNLAKQDLLVLEDFGLAPLTSEQRQDLFEIMEDRHNLRSTIVTSQIPLDEWHDRIGDPTLADAILDRLLHGAYTVEMKGESMRKQRAKAAPSAAS